MMSNMTLALPEELHEVIRRHSEIKWSEIARQAMWEYAKTLELLDRIAEKSKLTEEDVMELDNAIKRKVFQRHYRKYVK